uniref:PoNe immunity protein domain-containing protein n=1 Tax=uncultured Oscillibacter sp. TaxID=876091 RepID=UPI00261EC647
MRDTIKLQDYFLARIQADTARIKRFEETLKNTEPSNGQGIRLGKSHLSKLYLGCAKASYSVGADLGEVYSYYIQSINYYKDACTPADSLYGVIDYLSIGMLFQRSKQEFLSALEIMAEKFNSQDGLICCLLQYLQDKGKGTSPGSVKIISQISMQTLGGMKSAGNRGVLQSSFQVPHIHVLLVAP